MAEAGVQDEAARYRAEGYRQQQQHDYASAIASYQKAVQMDPSSAMLHNDLAIAFEGHGQLDRAEQEYLQALNLQSDYLEVFSNLALLYEKKGEREKAAYYWLQRAKYGTPEDVWTQRARERLVALGAVKDAEEVDVVLQQERLQRMRTIEETYAQAKAALESGHYAEAVTGFETTIALERAANRQLYTPLARQFMVEARKALHGDESGQLTKATDTRYELIEQAYNDARASFEAGQFSQAVTGFHRVIALEAQWHRPFYTPFAKDFIAQSREFMQRAENQALTSSQRTAMDGAAVRSRSSVVQDALRRDAESLREFRTMTEQQGGWSHRR